MLYDVTALFTCTPIVDSLVIIRDRLTKDPTLPSRTKLSVATISELLQFCLTNTYFIFQGQMYEQKEGTAMGSPVSPIVANLFMEDFEAKAIEFLPVKPEF